MISVNHIYDENALIQAQKRNNRIEKNQRERALSNIRTMEEAGLLAKGKNGKSNAEMYLYKMQQANLLLSSNTDLLITDKKTGHTTSTEVKKILSDQNGKTHKQVFNALLQKELTVDELKSMAQSVSKVEEIITKNGAVNTQIKNKSTNTSYKTDGYSGFLSEKIIKKNEGLNNDTSGLGHFNELKETYLQDSLDKKINMASKFKLDGSVNLDGIESVKNETKTQEDKITAEIQKFISDHKENTLFAAADKNRSDVIKYLAIQKDFNPNIVESDLGNTAAHKAAQKGNIEVLKALSEVGADIQRKNKIQDTPIHIAAIEGQVEAIQTLHKLGADVNSGRGSVNFTPAHYAAAYGQTKALTALHEMGADMNATGLGDQTPAHLAAFHGKTESLQTLHQLGADITKKDGLGKTPFQIATQMNKIESASTINSLCNQKKIKTEQEKPVNIENDDKIQSFVSRHKQDALLVATEKNRLDVIKYLATQKDFNPNITESKHGNTALHIAAQNGNTEILKALKESGANTEIHNRMLEKPIHTAIFADRPESIRTLHQLGADIEQKNIFGKTPIEIADQFNRSKAVKELNQLATQNESHSNFKNDEKKLEASAFISKHGNNAIFAAARENRPDVIKQLATNKSFKPDISEKYGNPALYIAAQKGNIEALKALQEAGADIDIPGKDGCTPLYGAAQNGHTEVVKELYKMGADINTIVTGPRFATVVKTEKGYTFDNQPNKYGLSPAYAAAANGHTETIKALHEMGAHLNIPDKNGRTAIHLAAANGHFETVEALHKSSINIETKDKNGETPLHLAAYYGETETVKTLHKMGADIEAKNKNNETPEQLAFSNEYKETADTLKGIKQGEKSKENEILKNMNKVFHPLRDLKQNDNKSDEGKKEFPENGNTSNSASTLKTTIAQIGQLITNNENHSNHKSMINLEKDY